MTNHEFKNLKQGFQDALAFIKHQPVNGTKIETFTVKTPKHKQKSR